MIFPVVHTPHQASEADPHKELRVALRLLSGQDCQRDASAAQVMLLKLGEGRHKKVAQDAIRY
ncbi:MAG: hypothetical protein ACI80V_000368 [Rhodothermales bacterium]|jgi:hypothetical protein